MNPYGQGLCHCGCLYCRLRVFSVTQPWVAMPRLCLKARRTLLSVLTILPLPSLTFWTWQLLCAALSGIIWITVMGNRPSHCSFDNPFGCFTNTLISVFQTELLISTSLVHLKPFLLVFSISVNVSTHLLKPDAWETSWIPSLFFNFHITKSDDFYHQISLPICSLSSFSSLLL